MAKKSKSSKKPVGQRSLKKVLQRIPWGFVVAALFIVVAIIVWYWQTSTQNVFSIEEGNKELVVLLRNEEDGQYTLKYTGKRSAELTSLKVMLGGKIIHADVLEVGLAYQGMEVILNKDGSVPAGNEIMLAPGDVITVRVRFRGQTLGGNYLYGFRVGYALGGRERTYDLLLNMEYIVVVE
ncbi:MAG: hypothetical protein AB1345_01770 [Chloroflexota bacterium]